MWADEANRLVFAAECHCNTYGASITSPQRFLPCRGGAQLSVERPPHAGTNYGFACFSSTCF